MTDLLRLLERHTAAPRRLSDGTIGYPIRLPRSDDCFAAAIATCLQVPIEEVPDAAIDQRLAAGVSPDEIRRLTWKELKAWLSERGLRLVHHKAPPVKASRWIGIVPIAGEFNDHSMVMAKDRLLFDPTDVGLIRCRLWGPDDVLSGFTFPARKARNHN